MQARAAYGRARFHQTAQSMTRRFHALSASALLIGLTASAGPAQARDGLDLSADYIADISATVGGGSDRKARYLDNVKLGLDADLEALWGVSDTSVHVDVLGNFGLRPNDAAGTIEGVDNIEVGRAAVRLFEAWAERRFSAGSLRVGLYDLNSEFYATDSSALLIAPPFGIGSELAATGSNGPSIFPSSALAVRLRLEAPSAKAFAQVAVLNAKAQTLGDPGGIDLGFREGLLAIGEAGLGDRLRGSIGIWTYTRPAEALASLGPAGDPLRERPAGIFGTAEAHLAPEGKRDVAVFVRGGAARGKTQPFTASLQAGVLIAPAIAGRKDSAFSFGFHQSQTSADFRAAQMAVGETAWERERGVEITYADAVLPHLTLQPDFQLIERTSAASRVPITVHATLRVKYTF